MSGVERPVSKTAWKVAAWRAAHQVVDTPVVLDDPIAIPILGEDVVSALRGNPAAYEQNAAERYLRAFVVARSLFAEGHLDAARDDGVEQYVILGAGLDTFAYRRRREEPALLVFEVDQPVTQAWKRARLAAAGIAEPANVRYVPIDFERDVLPSALARAGFDTDAGAVFAWLGVTMYLTQAAIDATLAFVASACGRAGGVTFDYALDPVLLAPVQRAFFDAMAARAEAVGEPWRTTFQPERLAARLRGLGFADVEDVGADELNARYFADRADGLCVGGLGRIVWAGAQHSMLRNK